MNPVTLDPLVSPVSTQELADYLRLDDNSDPVLQMMIDDASDMIMRYIGYDISTEPREWTLTLQDWPYTGTRSNVSIGRLGSYANHQVPLLYAALIGVVEVSLSGELVTADHYKVISEPASICLNPTYFTKQCDDPAIVVKYTAGMPQPPSAIKSAVIKVAAYLYEHRGLCTPEDALNSVGAKNSLAAYRNPLVMI